MGPRISLKTGNHKRFLFSPLRWRDTWQLPRTGHVISWSVGRCTPGMDKRPRPPRSREVQALTGARPASMRHRPRRVSVPGVYPLKRDPGACGKATECPCPVSGHPAEPKVMVSETQVPVRRFWYSAQRATACLLYVVARMETAVGLRSNSTGPIRDYFARTHWYD